MPRQFKLVAFIDIHQDLFFRRRVESASVGQDNERRLKVRISEVGSDDRRPVRAAH